VIDGRVLRSFDFDDSHFGWLVNDIAITYHRAVTIHLRYGNGSDAADRLKGRISRNSSSYFLDASSRAASNATTFQSAGVTCLRGSYAFGT
jgi:hypothetical protein